MMPALFSSMRALSFDPLAPSTELAAAHLLERLRQGESRALGEAYDQHHQAVRAFAGRLLGDRLCSTSPGSSAGAAASCAFARRCVRALGRHIQSPLTAIDPRDASTRCSAPTPAQQSRPGAVRFGAHSHSKREPARHRVFPLRQADRAMAARFWSHGSHRQADWRSTVRHGHMGRRRPSAVLQRPL